MDLPWAEVCGRRLARHGLTPASRLGSLAEAAAAMCGAHAQVLRAAEVSIGLRTNGVHRTAVQQALWSDHRLIKTFGPRGTVHLLSAADLPLWCGALSAMRAAPQFPPGMGLTGEQTDELIIAIGMLLADAELTVDELTGALADQVGPWAADPVIPAFRGMWPRWRQVTEIAARRGLLCFGPDKGRKVTYTSPARWLPGFAPAPAAQATSWLLDRYLYSYGPATPRHFARWLATAPARAQALFEAADLTEVSVEGTRAWVASGDGEPGEPARGALLLPYFDPFAVGSQPRELLFPGAARGRAMARGQAGNHPVLLIDGVVAGVWHQKKAGARVDITVEPLGTLTAAHRRQVDEQAARIGAILEARPSSAIGPVSAGAHA